jgi:hypothetical protein
VALMLTLPRLDAARFGRHARDPEDELNALFARSASGIEEELLGMVGAVARGDPGEDSVASLAEAVAGHMILADLMGRRRLLLEADAADGGMEVEDREVAVFAAFAGVPAAEAVEDLVSREPRLAATAEEVARLYRERHAFAVARTALVAVTKRVRAFLAKVLRVGADRPKATEAIAALGGYAHAHAETIYRTNLSTAYNAGRFAQARDPDVAKVFGAFYRYEVIDADVRRGRAEDHGENHAAAHGLIAAATDPVWRSAAAPAGYNCRGGQRMISKRELDGLGLLDPRGRVIPRYPTGFSSYRPHPDFVPSSWTSIYG